MNTKSDFSKGAVWKNILALAGPMTAAQIVQVLYSVVDRVYLGHLGSGNSHALTGLGLTFPVITIIVSFTLLFSTGGVPLFSISRGAGDEERAGKVMGNTFSLLLVTGVVLMAVFYLTMRPVLYLFGASDATYPYAARYLSVYLTGTLFSMISTGMNGFISAQGFAKTGMLTTVIGAILNTALDPLFIFVFRMGIVGAAAATVISQLVSATWVLLFLTGKKSLYRLNRKLMPIVPGLPREIMSLGLAGFFMGATNSAVQIACNATLQTQGGDLYVGVMTILNSVREIVVLPVNGLVSGVQPVLGYNFGAKKYDRVKEGIRFTTFAGVIYTLLAWMVVFFFPRFFFRLFTDDPSTIIRGIPAMHIYFFGFFMMAFQFTGQSVFTGLGQSRFAVFFSILRKLIIVVPLTILLPGFGFGVQGVFLAEPISNFIGGLACYTTMLIHTRRLLRSTPE